MHVSMCENEWEIHGQHKNEWEMHGQMKEEMHFMFEKKKNTRRSSEWHTTTTKVFLSGVANSLMKPYQIDITPRSLRNCHRIWELPKIQ